MRAKKDLRNERDPSGHLTERALRARGLDVEHGGLGVGYVGPDWRRAYQEIADDLRARGEEVHASVLKWLN